MQLNTTASMHKKRKELTICLKVRKKGMMTTMNSKLSIKAVPAPAKSSSNALAVDTLFTTTESASYNHSQDSIDMAYQTFEIYY